LARLPIARRFQSVGFFQLSLLTVITYAYDAGKRALKLLARYLEDPSNGELVLMQLKEWLSDPVAAANKTLITIAASIFILNDNVNEAFRVLAEGKNIEQRAMLIQLCLKIHRLDLAQPLQISMKLADEEGALTAMATAWLHIYTVL
jgi:coatomer protein complex subunit epsilon